VDAETGAREPLTRLDAASFGNDFRVATDLWAAPIAPGHRPPYVLDPRVKLGLVVVLLLASGYGIRVWRRRVRA